MTLIKWMKNIEPKKTSMRKSRVDIKELEEDIKQYPDSYIYERAARFKISKSGMQYTLKRLNITSERRRRSPRGRLAGNITLLRSRRFAAGCSQRADWQATLEESDVMVHK